MELMVTSNHILLLELKVPELNARQKIQTMMERERLLQQSRSSSSLFFKSEYYNVTKVFSPQELKAILLSKAQHLLQLKFIQNVLQGDIGQLLSTPPSPSKLLTLAALNGSAHAIVFSPKSNSEDSPGECQWQIWPDYFISFKAKSLQEFQKNPDEPL